MQNRQTKNPQQQQKQTNKQTKKTAHFKTAARPSNYKEFNFVIGTWRHAENLELQKED